jgi:tetratricopeptide (TPR) repeat protein
MTEQSFSFSDSYYSWYQQGKVQSDAEQYEQAITSFDRALQDDPNAHDAWYCRGNALFYLKRHEEAINSYEQATRIQPDIFLAWESHGLSLMQLQRYKEAIASLNRAVEIRSDSYIFRATCIQSTHSDRPSTDSNESAFGLVTLGT